MTLDTLKSNHREILRLDIAGFQQTEIAQRLEITPQTVRNVQGTDLYKQKKASLEDQADKEVITARKILADGAVSAARKVVELVDIASSDVVKLNASKDVLDRTGHKPQEGPTTNYYLTVEALERLKSRAREVKDVTPG